MSIRVYPADYRYHYKCSGLIITQTFSDQESFHGLIALNEHYLKPGLASPSTLLRNRELFTFVISGGIAHQDSLGNQVILNSGDTQYISTDEKFVQCESNLSDKIPASFLQIEFNSNDKKSACSYYQRNSFDSTQQPNSWHLIASNTKSLDTLKINQNVNIYLLNLEKGREIEFKFKNNRIGWLQILDGEAKLENETLQLNDGASISDCEQIKLSTPTGAKALFIELESISDLSH